MIEKNCKERKINVELTEHDIKLLLVALDSEALLKETAGYLDDLCKSPLELIMKAGIIAHHIADLMMKLERSLEC